MTKPIVVLMNWIKMPVTQITALAHNISVKLTVASAIFASPAIPPEILDGAARRLELAYANRMNGAAAKTEFENAETALDEMLHAEAAYVNDVAKGDAAIIEMAGFTATSNIRKPAVIPVAPNAPAITGNAAALHLQIPAVPGADSYCWVIFTDDSTRAAVAETHVELSGAGIVIPDGISRETLRSVVTPGAKINVQVLAQNTAGKSGFSPAVSFTVGS